MRFISWACASSLSLHNIDLSLVSALRRGMQSTISCIKEANLPIRTSLQHVREEIGSLSLKYNVKEPTLIAVSKKMPIEAIEAAYECGQRDFGENYPLELVEKAQKLPQDIRWHMIGHVQSNKSHRLLSIPNLEYIQTIDSEKLADKLESLCNDINRMVKVLVQVNTSEETTQSGVPVHMASSLFSYIERSCPHLIPNGLMTIAHTDHTLAQGCFDAMQSLKADILTGRGDNDPLTQDFILSMGMSGDLELAVAKGSTAVRIGTAIFGQR